MIAVLKPGKEPYLAKRAGGFQRSKDLTLQLPSVDFLGVILGTNFCNLVVRFFFQLQKIQLSNSVIYILALSKEALSKDNFCKILNGVF